MSSLGKRLIKAAREARAIARGEADPSTYRVHTPAGDEIKRVRHGLKLSQPEAGLTQTAKTSPPSRPKAKGSRELARPMSPYGVGRNGWRIACRSRASSLGVRETSATAGPIGCRADGCPGAAQYASLLRPPAPVVVRSDVDPRPG